MFLDDLAEKARKENIISIVTNMTMVDGEVHENEFFYLLKLGLSFGLTAEEVREIILQRDSTVYIPHPEEDRIEILYYLVFLMKADGKISKEESELLYHYGLKLGFNHLMIDNIISIVKANVTTNLSPDALLNEIKKYLN